METSQPLQLHSILANLSAQNQIMTQGIQQLQQRIANLSVELAALHQLVAKRRLTKGGINNDTPESLANDLYQRVKLFYSDTGQPMLSHYLVRIFIRRISAIGLRGTDMIKLLEDRVKAFTCGTGGIMLLPIEVWNAATEEQHFVWYNLTPMEIKKTREFQLVGMQAALQMQKEIPPAKQGDFFEAAPLTDLPSVDSSPLEGTPSA